MLSLLLSSVASGVIATAVMLLFLYLPRLWHGAYYDVLGALGSALTRRLDDRAYVLGALVYTAGGVVFAFLYGLVALALLDGGRQVPQLVVLPGFPVEINLFFPLVGLLIGLVHGVVVALLVTIVIEHHPLDRFGDRYVIALSQVIGHLAFGATVMFFHSQLLQLLLARV